MGMLLSPTAERCSSLSVGKAATLHPPGFTSLTPPISQHLQQIRAAGQVEPGRQLLTRQTHRCLPLLPQLSKVRDRVAAPRPMAGMDPARARAEAHHRPTMLVPAVQAVAAAATAILEAAAAVLTPAVSQLGTLRLDLADRPTPAATAPAAVPKQALPWVPSSVPVSLSVQAMQYTAAVHRTTTGAMVTAQPGSLALADVALPDRGRRLPHGERLHSERLQQAISSR